jgi:hypothetical protein
MNLAGAIDFLFLLILPLLLNCFTPKIYGKLKTIVHTIIAVAAITIVACIACVLLHFLFYIVVFDLCNGSTNSQCGGGGFQILIIFLFPPINAIISLVILVVKRYKNRMP